MRIGVLRRQPEMFLSKGQDIFADAKLEISLKLNMNMSGLFARPALMGEDGVAPRKHAHPNAIHGEGR